MDNKNKGYFGCVKEIMDEVDAKNLKPRIINNVFIVFLVLKLSKFISWSWWWIASPLWIWATSITLLVLVVGFFMYIGEENAQTSPDS